MMSFKNSALLGFALAVPMCLLIGCSQAPQEQQANYVDSALTTVIDQCGDMTERAAAHLVAKVEFQRLEIIGRKARVFKMCMQDHGYIENKAWFADRHPEAVKISNMTSISINEALENLRRADMVIANDELDRPIYWVKEIKNTP